MFIYIAELINSNIRGFKQYQLEIETSIVCMLAHLTSAPSGASKDPLTVAARRRAVQQGFVDSFFKKCVKIDYKLTHDPNNNDSQDFSEEDSSPQRFQNLSSSLQSPLGLEKANLSQKRDFDPNDAKFDDVERLESTNQFVEDTFMLASNVTELTENHYALVNPSS